MEKKNNLLSVFNRNKRRYERTDQPVEPQKINNENEDSSDTCNNPLFELMKGRLSGYELSLIENKGVEEKTNNCPKCGDLLHRVENMIAISDDDLGVLGLNGYYCYSCNTIHIDISELLDIQNFINNEDTSTLKMSVLANCEHNMDMKRINGLLHREKTLRDILDKINDIKEDEKYKIVKAIIPPDKCPICGRLFSDINNALTLYRDDCDEEYAVNGWCCKECGLIYLSERTLVECIKGGVTSRNLSEAIINEELDEEQRIKKLLERGLADGKTLYIHGGNIICEQQHHNIVSVTAEVPSGLDGKLVQININYCIDCDRCFINQIVYDSYRLRGELPLIKFAKVKADGSFPNEYEPELAEESPLHLLGYNVSKSDDYSDSYRQNLLGQIMDSGALSKHTIENYLSLFIQKGSTNPNMELAVSKWKKDLFFVEHFNLNRQMRVKISSIKSLN